MPMPSAEPGSSDQSDLHCLQGAAAGRMLLSSISLPQTNTQGGRAACNYSLRGCG